MHVFLHACCYACLHASVIENKLIKKKSCDCQHVISLLWHEIESLIVQRTNEVPIAGLLCSQIELLL